MHTQTHDIHCCRRRRRRCRHTKKPHRQILFFPIRARGALCLVGRLAAPQLSCSVINSEKFLQLFVCVALRSARARYSSATGSSSSLHTHTSIRHHGVSSGQLLRVPRYTKQTVSFGAVYVLSRESRDRISRFILLGSYSSLVYHLESVVKSPFEQVNFQKELCALSYINTFSHTQTCTDGGYPHEIHLWLPCAIEC